MPHQEELNSIGVFLNQIKRCYSITQKYVEIRPVSSFSISREIMTEAKTKLNAFEHEEKKHMRYVDASSAKNRYLPQSDEASPQTLEQDTMSLTQCASDVYHYLNEVHRALSRPLVERPGDFHDIVTHVLSTTQSFELALGRLSDYILSKKVVSPAFSLTRHTERLPLLYQESYEKTYNQHGFFSLGFLYAFKRYFRTPSRMDDINFLSCRLSTDSSCDDHMRLTAFFILIHRITDAKARGSLLKLLLEKGRDCTTTYINSKSPGERIETLNDFCHENSIPLPEDLQCYMDHKLKHPESGSLII